MKTALIAELSLTQVLTELRASRGLRTYRDPVNADYKGELEMELLDTGTASIPLARSSPAGTCSFLVVRTTKPVNFTLTGTDAYSGQISSLLVLTQPQMNTLTLTGIAGQGTASLSVIYCGINT
jgi:hypothetical protein